MKKLLERLIGIEVTISLKCGEEICESIIVAVKGNTLISRNGSKVYLTEIPHIAFVTITNNKLSAEYLIKNINLDEDCKKGK